MNASKPRWIAVVVLFLLTLAVYAPVRGFDFVRYDDPGYVYENPAVQAGLNARTVHWAFNAKTGGFWQPLTMLSHMADVQFHGMNPGRHHLTNVLIHALNATLLLLFLNLATGSLWRSFFVASLFALHPINVESVAWIAERKNVLSTLFWMGALISYWWYVQRPSRQRELLTFALFACGLMTKAMVITLPFVMLLLDWWPLKRVPDSKFQVPSGQEGRAGFSHQLSAFKSLLSEKLPLFFLVLAAAFITFQTQHAAGAVVSTSQFGMLYRLEHVIVNYARYIGLLLWPVGLASLYPQTPTLPHLYVFLAALAFLVAVTIFVIRFGKRLPYLPVGWFWFLGTLVPVIGIVMLGYHSIADRFAYIPAIGIFIMIVWGSRDIVCRIPKCRPIAFIIAALLLATLATVTRGQIRYWKNSEALFQRAIDVTEGNYVMYENLGREKAAAKQLDKAITLFEEAVRIDPSYIPARANLSLAYLQNGDTGKAVDSLRETAATFPGNSQVRCDVGMALARLGNFPEATVHLQEAIRINPNLGPAQFTMGMVLMQSGKRNESIPYFKEAARLMPDNPQVQQAVRNL